jgi:hypothetical protein
LLVHILRQCGDDLTRENVMRQATSLKNFVSSLSLPGMVVNTSPTDYRINKQMQMMKFDGERWELFGPILEDTGPDHDSPFQRSAVFRDRRFFCPLLRDLAEGFADRENGVPDQARVLDAGLPVFHGFAVDRIADHFGESGDARIFGDEAMIPPFLGGPDQHQFEPALPDDPAA